MTDWVSSCARAAPGTASTQWPSGPMPSSSDVEARHVLDVGRSGSTAAAAARRSRPRPRRRRRRPDRRWPASVDAGPGRDRAARAACQRRQVVAVVASRQVRTARRPSRRPRADQSIASVSGRIGQRRQHRLQDRATGQHQRRAAALAPAPRPALTTTRAAVVGRQRLGGFLDRASGGDDLTERFWRRRTSAAVRRRQRRIVPDVHALAGPVVQPGDPTDRAERLGVGAVGVQPAKFLGQQFARACAPGTARRCRTGRSRRSTSRQPSRRASNFVPSSKPTRTAAMPPPCLASTGT